MLRIIRTLLTDGILTDLLRDVDNHVDNEGIMFFAKIMKTMSCVKHPLPLFMMH